MPFPPPDLNLCEINMFYFPLCKVKLWSKEKQKLFSNFPENYNGNVVCTEVCLYYIYFIFLFSRSNIVKYSYCKKVCEVDRMM